MKVQIRLDTNTDIQEFVAIATNHRGKVFITDGNGLRVNAKSYLGVAYSRLEFETLWCESEDDIYSQIDKFIVL